MVTEKSYRIDARHATGYGAKLRYTGDNYSIMVNATDKKEAAKKAKKRAELKDLETGLYSGFILSEPIKSKSPKYSKVLNYHG